MRQISYWGNVDYPSNQEARLERDRMARQLRKAGHEIRCWTLRNQLQKYSSFGQPDGRSGNVYYIDVTDHIELEEYDGRPTLDELASA